jgi:hypothetical protein
MSPANPAPVTSDGHVIRVLHEARPAQCRDQVQLQGRIAGFAGDVGVSFSCVDTEADLLLKTYPPVHLAAATFGALNRNLLHKAEVILQRRHILDECLQVEERVVLSLGNLRRALLGTQHFDSAHGVTRVESTMISSTPCSIRIESAM